MSHHHLQSADDLIHLLAKRRLQLVPDAVRTTVTRRAWTLGLVDLDTGETFLVTATQGALRATPVPEEP